VIPSAPLLWRQLALEASHGRTFWVRPLFGLLIAGGLVLASGVAGNRLLSGEGLESGSGKALFDALMVAAVLAIYLGLPALVAPAVAAEEERGTLDLLRIAGIRPLALIGQLAGARLAMAATLALAAAPLAALAYSCGGVSDRRMLAAGLCLAVAACQVAACAAAVGARRLPSTRAAFSAYRDVIVHLIIVLPFASALFSGFLSWSGFSTYSVPWTFYQAMLSGGSPWLAVAGGLLPAALSIAWHLRQAARRMRRRSSELPPAQAFLMARWKPSARWQKEVRKWRLQHGLDRGELPADDALAWRSELYAPLLGQRLQSTRLKVFGCFTPIFATVVLFNAIAVLTTSHGRMSGVLGIADCAMGVVLVLAVHAAAAALPRERANGSREVLASMPLSGAEVARGLSAGAWLLLRRTLLVFTLTLAVCALIEFRLAGMFEAMLMAGLAVVLAGAARWGGLVLGSRFAQPLAAGTIALGAVAAVAVLPWLASRLAETVGQEALAPWLAMLSPFGFASAVHGESLEQVWPALGAIGFWLAAWIGLRAWSHRRMDHWLGRTA